MSRSRIRLFPLALLGLALAARAEEPLPAARVVLPWSDFKELYRRGMAPEEKPAPAPKDYAISHATYAGRVEGEAAVFQARLQVEVLKDKGWVTVPLLPTSVALRSARLGNSDAPIYLENGWYYLITNRRGLVSLDLEFAASTFDSSGQQGFAFSLAPSGGTEVTLRIPGSDDLDVDVANAQQLTVESRQGARELRALLPATGNLSVSWHRKAPAVAPEALASRVYAEVQTLVGVAEGLLQCQSAVNYSILHTGVSNLSLSLPPEVTVLDVRGQGVRDWTLSRDAAGTSLSVALNFEAKGAYTLLVDYETALPEGDGTANVPALRLGGVERVKGFVGIDARSSLEISAGAAQGAGVVDVRELPPAILGKTDWPVLLGYKITRPDYQIPLNIRTHEAVDLLVTLIDQAAATTVLTPDGRRMTQVVYAMRNNRAQFLRLKLPDGAVPWSTFVAGRSVKPGRDDDGTVLIPLTRSQNARGDLARFAVELVYVEEGTPPVAGRGHFDAALPIADVPSTGVAWTIYTPRGAKVSERSIDGSLRRVDWYTPVDVSGNTAIEAVQAVQQQADAVLSSEAMAEGVQPVKVNLPIDGDPHYFEKLLVFDEPLIVSFDWRAP